MLIVVLVAAWLYSVGAQERLACPPGVYLLAERTAGCPAPEFGRNRRGHVDGR